MPHVPHISKQTFTRHFAKFSTDDFRDRLTRCGVDLVTVAELMGNASLETTRLYTRPSEADMQRAGLLTADE